MSGQAKSMTASDHPVNAQGTSRAAKTDMVTVLLCKCGTATKRAVRNAAGAVEFIQFSAGKYFRFSCLSVASIYALSEVLQAAEDLWFALVIRGMPEPSLNPQGDNRRQKLNFKTPADGHQWILVDVDHIQRPKGLRGKLDSKAVREYVVSLLPKEFHDVTYHWQLSSRAGFGDTKTISIHLWFWLAYAVSDADLRRWAEHVNNGVGFKLIDPALFNDVQPHYTAAPIFVGVDDPFPVRSGLERKANDEVAIVLPQATPEKRAARRSGAKLEPAVGFDGWLARIGDHKGGDGFHEPIIRAAASYVGSHGADDTDTETLYERIRDAVLVADRSAHEDAYVEHMASREHIVAAIEGAITKFGEGGNARRKAKRVDGVPPYYPTESVPAASAFESLAVEIDRIFQAR